MTARGKGGFVRANWDEAIEIAAAAQVHTIKTWDPTVSPGSEEVGLEPFTPPEDMGARR